MHNRIGQRVLKRKPCLNGLRVSVVGWLSGKQIQERRQGRGAADHLIVHYDPFNRELQRGQFDVVCQPGEPISNRYAGEARFVSPIGEVDQDLKQ